VKSTNANIVQEFAEDYPRHPEEGLKITLQHHLLYRSNAIELTADTEEISAYKGKKRARGRSIGPQKAQCLRKPVRLIEDT
jgi:hypothetical protein